MPQYRRHIRKFVHSPWLVYSSWSQRPGAKRYLGQAISHSKCSSKTHLPTPEKHTQIHMLYISLPFPAPLYIYFCALGPATPAPITLGRSSCPTLAISPTPQLTAPMRAIEIPASKKNGALISFFWQAGPPQDTVFTFPSSPVSIVLEHLQAKHSMAPPDFL